MDNSVETSWKTLRRLLVGDLHPGPVAPEVIEAARRAEVLGVLAERCPAVARECQEELASIAAIQMHVTLAIRDLAECLIQGGITRAALLKGNATSLLLYSAPHLRPSGDVDVLVDPRDFTRVIQVLEESGWVDAMPTLSAAAFGDAPYSWCFDGSFGDVQLQCDVHQGLTLSDTLRVNHKDILDRAEAHPESPLPLCHPEDLFLGGALHVAKESFDAPLKSWLDLALLLQHPRVSLERCVERAGQWGMGNITWATLRVLERWELAEVPRSLQDALRPAAPVARIIDALLRGMGQRAPLFPSDNRVSYFLPGPLMGDDPRAAGRWLRWRFASLIRAERRRLSL